MRASRSAAPRFAAPIAAIAWLLLATVAFVQVYLLLHEAGHALAAWSVGGTVRTLDARPWSTRPHAAYDLHGASDAARAFISAAGTLLPYVAWALALLAVPRRLAAPYAVMRLAATIGILASLTVWMVLPWRAFHAATPGDDVVRFTLTSGWPPALVVATAAALFLAGAAWAWWRVGGRTGVVALTRTRSLAVTWRVVGGTAFAVVALVALVVGLHAAFPGAAAVPVDAALVLPEHAPLADRSFSGGPVDLVLAEGVAYDGALHLVLGYDEVAGGPLRLQVLDALGAPHGVGAFGPDTTMGRATSRPRLTVAPGPWSLRLSAEDLRGRVRVWEVADPAR
jgi:hypothetical protein